jgi:hypothetical protein
MLLDSCWALMKGYLKAAGRCPKLLESVWAILEGYRQDAEKCPNTRRLPIGEKVELPSGYWQKHCNFYPFSPKRRVYVYNYEKSKELRKIFLNAQLFFSYFCSFQPCFYLPNSKWCDSPFKMTVQKINKTKQKFMLKR